MGGFIVSSKKIIINQFSPIVLFVYNRPWHTEQTLRALKANDFADQSILYIYSDSPKHLALQEDLDKIDKVRQLAKSEKWCKEVNVIESPRNLGLVNSFVKGITEIVNRHDKVIVLEDDQITSKGFLKYMNEALELYKNDQKVMHISAYMYPARFKCKETTFFLNIQSCPGWGTWKRAWELYNHDASDHLRYFSQNKKLIKKFDIEGHAYFYKQLQKNVEQINFSWAVRWYASCLRVGGLSLFPAKSLIKNIGLDGSGVHCRPTTMYDVEPVDYLPLERIDIKENLLVRKAVDKYYKVNIKKSVKLLTRIKYVIYNNLIKNIRNITSYLLIKVFPELSMLKSDKIGWNLINSFSLLSDISKKVKISVPYHLNNSSVGDYSYIQKNSWMVDTYIGKFCSIGPNFMSGFGIHPVNGISTSPMFYSLKMQNGFTLSKYDKIFENLPVTIGNDVFIGMNVTVLCGVTIGDGAVVGACSVVTKDVPPYAIVAGNPSKIIRFRFSEDKIQSLIKIKWWEWTEEKLKLVEKYFFDVEEFILKNKLE
jgi:acetyltransferase-like isoleucine patch superfamily enzyme